MKILVTGATGFLGRVLHQRLKDEGHEVIISNSEKLNLLNPITDDLGRLDQIWHLAVDTKAGDYCLTHTGDQWISNQLINTNILNYWRNYQPQAKMICMGTSCSYDNSNKRVEKNYLEGTPESSLETYAATKRMLLQGLKAIDKQDKLEWNYFIPATLYGPDFLHNDHHFIFDLIRKIYSGSVYNDSVVLWGNGKQKRELFYVDDAVESMIDIVNRGWCYSNSIYNIGTGKSYSIRHYAKIICEEFGYDFNKIIWNTDKYTGAKKVKLDVTKFHHDFDLAPITIGEGIRRVCNAYRVRWG